MGGVVEVSSTSPPQARHINNYRRRRATIMNDRSNCGHGTKKHIHRVNQACGLGPASNKILLVYHQRAQLLCNDRPELLPSAPCLCDRDLSHDDGTHWRAYRAAVGSVCRAKNAASFCCAGRAPRRCFHQRPNFSCTRRATTIPSHN